MKIKEYENLIAQNNEKIKKKEAQVKKLQAEIKELKSKNDQLNDDLLLHQIKNEVPASDVSNLIMISKLIKETGLSPDELKEMFNKGENKNED